MQVVEAAAAERKLNLSFKGPRDHADHSLQVRIVWVGAGEREKTGLRYVA